MKCYRRLTMLLLAAIVALAGCGRYRWDKVPIGMTDFYRSGQSVKGPR